MASIQVFISHWSEEKELALAWQTLIKDSMVGKVKAWLSSDRTPGGGVGIGDIWRGRIYEELKEADYVLAIVSPDSLQRPWVPWECGVATGTSLERGLIPIVFSMSLQDLSGPMASYQAYSGEDEDQVREVCQRLAARAELETTPATFQGHVKSYLGRIKVARPAPMVHPSVFDLWLTRLQAVAAGDGVYGLLRLRDAFYRACGEGPSDIRIHDLLSEMLLLWGRTEEARDEIEFALSFSSSDPILLHRKGKVLRETGDLRELESLIDAVARNSPAAERDSALLELRGDLSLGRYRLKEDPNHRQAALGFYREAFKANPDSRECGFQIVALAHESDQPEIVGLYLESVQALYLQHTQGGDARPQDLYRLGALHLVRGENDQAVAAYQRAVGVCGKLKGVMSPWARSEARRLARVGSFDIREIEEVLET